MRQKPTSAVRICLFSSVITQKKMGFSMKQTLQNVVFMDSDNIAEYAADAINAIASAGIVSGKPGNIFALTGNATRAEVAAMLHRFCEAAK